MDSGLRMLVHQKEEEGCISNRLTCLCTLLYSCTVSSGGLPIEWDMQAQLGTALADVVLFECPVRNFKIFLLRNSAALYPYSKKRKRGFTSRFSSQPAICCRFIAHTVRGQQGKYPERLLSQPPHLAARRPHRFVRSHLHLRIGKPGEHQRRGSK